MAKNKRPFSSFLENAETNKAVQEALHAPALLPNSEPTPEPAATGKQQLVEDSPAETPTKLKPGRKPKSEDEKEEYTVITIRKSVHKYLKMAATQNDVEIRELASEAIADHPLVKAMMEKFG
ncbi:MAG: hypothetical protein LH609_16265 [Rudanella sp.]|nr:hypothetical protein [Rudanella sp.]